MQGHTRSFISRAEASNGFELPRFIEDGFAPFLDAASRRIGFRGCTAVSAAAVR